MTVKRENKQEGTITDRVLSMCALKTLVKEYFFLFKISVQQNSLRYSCNLPAA